MPPAQVASRKAFIYVFKPIRTSFPFPKDTLMAHTIYLIGARAAGKTTFGGALARQLGCNYVDTDIHLRETTGETVADIVSREGWDGFHKRESAVLREVTAPATVIATGGGMVLAEENRRFMRENGIVLYLSAPAEVLAARLQANPNAAQRPTLTGKSIAEEVAEVLAAREPLYRETATHILNAAATPKALLAEALALLKA